MNKDKRINLRIDAYTYKWLKKHAGKQKLTISKLIRHLINQLISNSI